MRIRYYQKKAVSPLVCDKYSPIGTPRTFIYTLFDCLVLVSFSSIISCRSDWLVYLYNNYFFEIFTNTTILVYIYIHHFRGMLVHVDYHPRQFRLKYITVLMRQVNCSVTYNLTMFVLFMTNIVL
mgnify:CR=1 FL=1